MRDKSPLVPSPFHLKQTLTCGILSLLTLAGCEGPANPRVEKSNQPDLQQREKDQEFEAHSVPDAGIVSAEARPQDLIGDHQFSDSSPKPPTHSDAGPLDLGKTRSNTPPTPASPSSESTALASILVPEVAQGTSQAIQAAAVEIASDPPVTVESGKTRQASEGETKGEEVALQPPTVGEKVKIRFAPASDSPSKVKVEAASIPAEQTIRPNPSNGSGVDLAVNDRKPQSTLDPIPVEAASGEKAPSAKTVETVRSNEQDSKKGIEVATEAERNQKVAEGWPKPWAALFLTGQLQGYMEPCGCTGLENQKGGLNRRDTLLSQIASRGWDMVPIDAGNQIRRMGRQSSMKFLASADSLKIMNYKAIGLGESDLLVSLEDLYYSFTSRDQNEGSPFVSSNIVVYGDKAALAKFKVVTVGARKIGITSVLAEEPRKKILGLQNEGLEVHPSADSVRSALEAIQKEKCDYRILIVQGSLDEANQMAKSVPGFDLIVTGGYGEPNYKPDLIEGTNSYLIQVGVKGMFVGLLGLYDDPKNPFRYQRIALSSQFEDSERMLKQFVNYQDVLKAAGFQGLGVRPITHSTGRDFVGSEQCGSCHTKAFEIWKETGHAKATESLIHPPERSSIARHFDPECLSCHVTGWNPQEYFPYKTGFLSVEKSPMMMNSGCENCHGPGSAHVAAEENSQDQGLLAKLRDEMKLPLDRAMDRCLECHDRDNSPDFHEPNAFEHYWEKVKHYGKD